MSPPPRLRALRAARASAAAAERVPSTVLTCQQKTPVSRARCLLKRKASAPGEAGTTGKRRTCKRVWKPLPRLRSPQKTLINFFCLFPWSHWRSVATSPRAPPATLLCSNPLCTYPHLDPIRGNIITLTLVLAHAPECRRSLHRKAGGL